MTFSNSWADSSRAESYSRLEFPNTYYLAYRDLPAILDTHVSGNRAVDFGCGTGRSTRFFRKLGYDVIGIDVAQDMLKRARTIDPQGDYRLVRDGDYAHIGRGQYDLVTSIFTFDNIAGWDTRTDVLLGLRDLLKDSGRMVLLDSTPELYTNEWASFSTKEFPDNWHAGTGDVVRDIMLDVEDRRPVEDIFWTEEDYRALFHRAGLEVEQTYKPLGRPDEPYQWISETRIAPWMIFVVRRQHSSD
jgi:SAM-dependent methyltransferase